MTLKRAFSLNWWDKDHTEADYSLNVGIVVERKQVTINKLEIKPEMSGPNVTVLFDLVKRV